MSGCSSPFLGLGLRSFCDELMHTALCKTNRNRKFGETWMLPVPSQAITRHLKPKRQPTPSNNKWVLTLANGKGLKTCMLEFATQYGISDTNQYNENNK